MIRASHPLKPSRPLNRGILAVVLGLVAAAGIYITAASHAATLAGDVNGDGQVNVTDLSLLLARWGTTDAAADLTKDGTVNIFDLSLLLAHWGQTAPTPTPTPTPPPTPVPTPAPAGSVRVIDSANPISDPNWFVQAYQQGYRLYVMHSTQWGTCTPWSNTQPQLKMALDAGLKIAVYTRDPTCWQGGIQAAGPYISQLQFFAIDVETDPGIKVTQSMVDGIKAMGVRPLIYSGSDMWSGVMGGNVTTFSSLPLWDCDTSQTIDPSTWVANVLKPTPVPYGGWNTSSNMRVGVQQQFEYNLNGIAVDLSSFSAAFLK